MFILSLYYVHNILRSYIVYTSVYNVYNTFILHLYYMYPTLKLRLYYVYNTTLLRLW